MTLSVAGRLRAAREQKSINLEEACRVTKIQKHILEAIEEGRVSEVLNPTYARIFLKKYAGYLGLDGTAVVDEYLDEPPSEREPLIQAEVGAAPKESARPRPKELLGAVAAAGVALVGVAFIVYLSVDLYSNWRNKVPTTTRAVSPRTAAPGKTPGPLVPSSKPLKLTVRASEKVWLQIKSDGGVVFQGVLNRGSQESWSAKQELEIWTGNASVTQLSLNGKPLEGLGRGVKKGIKVTHRGLVSP